MALESSHITSVIVEASEYPDLIQRYAIDAVPKIVINDRIELLGAQPEAVVVDAVLDSVREATPTTQEP